MYTINVINNKFVNLRKMLNRLQTKLLSIYYFLNLLNDIYFIGSDKEIVTLSTKCNHL